MQDQIRLLAEWQPQEAVVLAWPDSHTDWQHWLSAARATYLDLIAGLLKSTPAVIVLVREQESEALSQQLAKHFNGDAEPLSRIHLLTADYNDTWTRDYIFLTSVDGDGQRHPMNFEFNGWGGKFNASKDNRINSEIFADLCRHPMQDGGIVLEGGAVEIDDEGCLLSTLMCLSNPQRNGDLSPQAYEAHLTKLPGAKVVHLLAHGHLEGDDTDGHVDTLVRFTPDQGLVIQAADNRPDDSHFAGLSALVAECRAALPEHEIFCLPLPLIHNSDGERLPASYANFLINNDQVLCPVYGEAEDEAALDILRRAYPKHRIEPVNCRTLVEQFGSLHCVTMQIPTGTLQPSFFQNKR